MTPQEPPRSEAVVRAEYDHLVNSFAVNETARDSFLATAHTAIFAASIAFLGNITSFADAHWTALLIFGWISGVVGMISLTASFHVASRNLTKRMFEIRQRAESSQQSTAAFNLVALCSLPVSLVCLAAFAISNVVYPMSKDMQFKGVPTVDERQKVDAGVMAAPRLDQAERDIVEKGIAAAPRMPEEQAGTDNGSESESPPVSPPAPTNSD